MARKDGCRHGCNHGLVRYRAQDHQRHGRAYTLSFCVMFTMCRWNFVIFVFFVHFFILSVPTFFCLFLFCDVHFPSPQSALLAGFGISRGNRNVC